MSRKYLRRKSQSSDILAGKGCSGVIAQTNPLAKISLWCQNMNHASDRIIGLVAIKIGCF